MPALNLIERSFSLEESRDGFKNYLEQSLRDPFIVDLHNCTLIEVIKACIKAKSKQHRKYGKILSSLIYNLELLEQQYNIILRPIQITDIFWGYFISFCQDRGLKASSITTMSSQLRSVLTWAVRYNVSVSSTYTNFSLPKTRNQEIALTADEVSRITYFDVDRFYADRRKDYRDTMKRVRDMFVLSCNLYQRHSDMIRIDASCFNRNIFKITQQKTGCLAIVNIDRYSIDPPTTYRILETYGYKAPYVSNISNYNNHLHILMRDIGFTDEVRIEERVNGTLIVQNIPKYKLISSHTARRTAITINVLRGHNIHSLKKCSGHTDLRIFDGYVRDE